MSLPSSPVPSSSGGPAGPASPPQRSYRYRWWEASLVALDAVGGLLFAWTGVGAVFLLLGFLYAIWRDWRGVVSLRGVLPWSRLSRVEQIGLAIVLVLGAPLFFWVYCFQIVYQALREGGAGGFFRALGARIRAWPRAWQVMGALIASALICACCASGIAIIGANSPTPPTTKSGSNGGGGANQVAALTAPQMTATAQRFAQATQTASTAQQSADAVTTATALAELTATATPLPSPTVVPTAVPTARPTATPRPTAKPQPTKTPVPYVLSVTVTCASAVDYSYGQVCVHTHAGAQLTITVTYCSGYDATSKSLQGTETANGSGNYTWYWTPETSCRGTATADVTANWNGQYATAERQFTVQ